MPDLRNNISPTAAPQLLEVTTRGSMTPGGGVCKSFCKGFVTQSSESYEESDVTVAECGEGYAPTDGNHQSQTGLESSDRRESPDYWGPDAHEDTNGERDAGDGEASSGDTSHERMASPGDEASEGGRMAGGGGPTVRRRRLGAE